MQTYKAGNPPNDSAALPEFLRQELASLEQAANRADSHVALSYLAVTPARPQDGIYLSAAGVLGANRGAYRYDSSTGLFTFIA